MHSVKSQEKKNYAYIQIAVIHSASKPLGMICRSGRAVEGISNFVKNTKMRNKCKSQPFHHPPKQTQQVLLAKALHHILTQ